MAIRRIEVAINSIEIWVWQTDSRSVAKLIKINLETYSRTEQITVKNGNHMEYKFLYQVNVNNIFSGIQCIKYNVVDNQLFRIWLAVTTKTKKRPAVMPVSCSDESGLYLFNDHSFCFGKCARL
jgi:hypothetical protein